MNFPQSQTTVTLSKYYCVIKLSTYWLFLCQPFRWPVGTAILNLDGLATPSCRPPTPLTPLGLRLSCSEHFCGCWEPAVPTPALAAECQVSSATSSRARFLAHKDVTTVLSLDKLVRSQLSKF